VTAPDDLVAVLGDRFEIERELGRGGMAVVYLARDRRHGRRVALKVLRPELAASLAAERFRREIRIAAALTHPNILPLHEAAEDSADGPLYFVMPFVEGDTLRTHLGAGPLSVEEAVAITIEVAGALDYAHRQGIVHRDVKPENILLLEGHAVVADFGIAHAVDEAAREHLTQTGIMLGTPAYLSPEQIDGSRAIDGRSDVFSLGSVSYEMLTGAAPFAGPNVAATLARVTTGALTPLATKRPDVPPDVAAAVERALVLDRDGRFASAADFASALRAARGSTPLPAGSPAHVASGAISRAPRRMAIGAAVVVVALIALVLAATQWPRGTDDLPSLAILPFATEKGDTADTYLGAGIAEQILDALADVPGLQVKSRTSTFNLGPTPNMSVIARTLGARAVLEGSVARRGSLLHVTARLIDPVRDAPIWSQSFDEPAAGVFEMQEFIAKTIVHKLRVKLASDTMTIVHRRSRNAEAHDLVLRADFVARGNTADGLLAAVALLARAQALDSGYADVPAEQARVFESLAVYGDQALVPGYGSVTAGEMLRLARVAAERAVRLDERSSTAHAVLGLAIFRYDWDWPRAEGEFRRSMELNRASATTFIQYSRYLRSMGRFGEARAALDSAAKVDGHAVSPITYGRISYFAHDFARAVRETESAPNLGGRASAVWYAEALVEFGRYAAAESLFKPEKGGDVMGWFPAEVTLYARTGQLAAARALIASEFDLYSDSPILRASALAAIGDTTRALDDIDRAVAMHDPLVVDLMVNPMLDPLRRSPRFEAVIQRLKFPRAP
jgi:eukaryotic-like serine/threonine-protein kinase